MAKRKYIFDGDSCKCDFCKKTFAWDKKTSIKTLSDYIFCSKEHWGEFLETLKQDEL